jgi:hypothetical protein
MDNIFNFAKESLTAAGKGFSQKANDVSGLAKVTLKIKEEEKQLDASIKELGVQLYNTRNAEAKEMFPELTEKIRSLYVELEKDRIQQAFLKGKKICPNCGAELDMEVQCCTECGINVENVERPKPQEPAQVFCTNCGAAVPEGSKFCNNCGNKVGV